jgi:hypothetical protein
MQDDQQYQEAVRCLTQHGYRVTHDGQAYLVINLADPNDSSRARNLDDLSDLAELIQWRALHDVRLQHGR